MEITVVGTIVEYQSGALDIRKWAVGCDYPPSESEKKEMIDCAKENGTYFYIYAN